MARTGFSGGARGHCFIKQWTILQESGEEDEGKEKRRPGAGRRGAIESGGIYRLAFRAGFFATAFLTAFFTALTAFWALPLAF